MALRAFKDEVKNFRVDAMVDSIAVVYAWNREGAGIQG